MQKDLIFQSVLIVCQIMNIGPCLTKLQLPKFGAFSETHCSLNLFWHIRCYCVVRLMLLEQYFESSLSLSPGDSAMYINGLQVDLDVSDVFTLVELLRSESRMMEGLHSIADQYQLNSAFSQQLLKLDLRDTDTMYAVDIRDPSVIVCYCT